MKIIRNKYLTNIIGSNIELKLPTERYDDIVGIINGILPISTFTDKQLEDLGDNVIEFNGNKLLISELFQFADMNYKLYLSSVFNASSKFERYNSVNARAMLQINSIIINLSAGFIVGEYENVAKISQYTKCDKLINDGIRIIAPRDLHLKSIGSSKSYLINYKKLLDDDIDDVIDKIINIYSSITGLSIFYDSEGNEYTFSPLSKEEILTLIQKYFLFSVSSKKFNPFGTFEINIFKNIFIKSNTWKRYSSGILMLRKNGQETLVDISKLITENIYRKMKLQGKSIFLLDKFSEIPL